MRPIFESLWAPCLLWYIIVCDHGFIHSFTQVRRQALHAQLEPDWRQAAARYSDDDDDDGYVERLIKDDVDAVCHNLDHCNVHTLAALGAQLQYVQSTVHVNHQALVEMIGEQLWSSVVNPAQTLTTAQNLSSSTTINKVSASGEARGFIVGRLWGEVWEGALKHLCSVGLWDLPPEFLF